MLPFPRTGLAAPRRLLLRVFPPVDVPVDVRVPVDVDVHVAPVPVAMPPGVSPRDADGDPGEKRCPRVWGRVDVIRRVRGVRPHAVHHRGVVRRHVDDLRVGLLDDDDGLRILLDHHGLLLARLQIALVIRFLAELLNGVHDILLLREEGVPQFLRPVQLVGPSSGGPAGKFTSDLTLGSHSCFSRAFVRASPLRSLFCFTQLLAFATSRGYVDAIRSWVRRSSGYSATGARSWSSCSWENVLDGAFSAVWARTPPGRTSRAASRTLHSFRDRFLVAHGASCCSGQSGSRHVPCSVILILIQDTDDPGLKKDRCINSLLGRHELQLSRSGARYGLVPSVRIVSALVVIVRTHQI